MAYRRRHGITRSSTFKEEPEESSSPSLAAQAIRASSAYRDFSLSSAYGESAFASSYRDSKSQISPPPTNAGGFIQDSTSYEYTSMKNLNENKHGFWSVLAKKAKAILEDDNAAQKFESSERTRPQMLDTPTMGQFHQPYQSPDKFRKTDNPTLQKGLDAITSSLNYLGGTIGNAFEEGFVIMENRTADIIQETRKLHIKRRGSNSEPQNQGHDPSSSKQQPVMHFRMHADQETQLKASRDVAMAMAAKAKLLLRELKTLKADMAFSKERCAQLEEENKILRESHEKGDNLEDDDLIRLQLETLLAEKSRLAHENSVYARENRFLREIVEYHQLTMQDVVYLDEGIEEVTEVDPIGITASTNICSSAMPSPSPPPLPPPLLVPPKAPPTINLPVTENISNVSILPQEVPEVSQSANLPGNSITIPRTEDLKRHSIPSS